ALDGLCGGGLPQLEALRLARRGLGQRLDEVDPAGTLVFGNFRPYEVLQLAGQLGRLRMARRKHDIGHRLVQAIGIPAPDHARFLHRRVFNQGVLDLDRAHPDPTDLQHVIRAAGIPVIALGITVELVAGSDPVPFDRVLGPLVLVPVIGAGAVAFDQQVADGPVRYIIARLVDDPRLVSRHELAACAGADAAGPIRDEDMEDLGTADPVENFHAEAVVEAIVEGLGERLAGGHRVPDAG